MANTLYHIMAIHPHHDIRTHMPIAIYPSCSRHLVHVISNTICIPNPYGAPNLSNMPSTLPVHCILQSLINYYNEWLLNHIILMSHLIFYIYKYYYVNHIKTSTQLSNITIATKYCIYTQLAHKYVEIHL